MTLPTLCTTWKMFTALGGSLFICWPIATHGRGNRSLRAFLNVVRATKNLCLNRISRKPLRASYCQPSRFRVHTTDLRLIEPPSELLRVFSSADTLMQQRLSKLATPYR